MIANEPAPRGALRRYFLTGAVALVPIAVSFWVLSIVFGFLARVFNIIPFGLHFQSQPFFLKFVLLVGAAVLGFCALAFLGWASTHYFGRQTLNLIGRFMRRRWLPRPGDIVHLPPK